MGIVLLIAIIFSPLVALAGSNAAGDSVALNPVSPSAVVGMGTFRVSGNVTASTGSVTEICTNMYNYNPNCGLVVSVINPNNKGVAYSRPAVSGSGARGTFDVSFIAGNTSDWVAGTYTVVASYITSSDNTIPPAVSTVNFTYSTGTPIPEFSSSWMALIGALVTVLLVLGLRSHLVSRRDPGVEGPWQRAGVPTLPSDSGVAGWIRADARKCMDDCKYSDRPLIIRL